MVRASPSYGHDCANGHDPSSPHVVEQGRGYACYGSSPYCASLHVVGRELGCAYYGSFLCCANPPYEEKDRAFLGFDHEHGNYGVHPNHPDASSRNDCASCHDVGMGRAPPDYGRGCESFHDHGHESHRDAS